QALFDAVSPAAIKRIAKKIAKMAEEGDLDACKLLLQYLVGRPEAEPIDPDWVAERDREEREKEESLIAGREAALDQCLIAEMMALLRGPLERIDSLSAEEALAAACAVWGKLEQVHGIEDMEDDPELRLIGRAALTLLEKATPAAQTSQQRSTTASLLQTGGHHLGLSGGGVCRPPSPSCRTSSVPVPGMKYAACGNCNGASSTASLICCRSSRKEQSSSGSRSCWATETRRCDSGRASASWPPANGR